MTELNPELDPSTEQAVQALLRDARVTDPLPAHVAARMAHVLTTEWQERAANELTAHTPTRPASSGLRRRLPVLLAAASVVVGGVALGPQLLEQRAGDSAGSDAARSEAFDEAAVGEPQADQSLPPEIDLGNLRAEALTLWQDPATQTGEAGDGAVRSSEVGDCALPKSVVGDLIVPVLERGQPAWLVYTRRNATKVRVALHTCISGEKPVKKVTIAPS